MSDIAIRAENLGKWYQIGERERYTMLRDMLVNTLAVRFRSLSQTDKSSPTKSERRGFADLRTSPTESDRRFQALKGVSFEINRGEIVGIIGGNGAGKSTLLKILSRITEPSEGEAIVYGRIGSLLEVGTGFHPELTGRENVYLNGAIMGMKKAETNRKFDEIVAFAEIEKFVDTPVKRYSSGMYTRLGFSVAAHLETDIMVVDEVLAVGDAAFQKKCLGKMDDVAKEGRTVLFVSHNMAAIEHLCERVILLHAGQVKVDADPDRAVEEYLRIFALVSDDNGLSSIQRDPGVVEVLRRIEFHNEYGEVVNAIPVGSALTVKLRYKHSRPIKDPYFGLTFETMSGVRVFGVHTRLQKGTLPDIAASGVIECCIPDLSLVPGTYFVHASCGSAGIQLDVVPRASKLEVVEVDLFGTGRVSHSSQGLIVVHADWTVVSDSA